MAKPNYAFEKRQRELAKKRKKEEKASRKASPSQHDDAPDNQAQTGEGSADTPPPAAEGQRED
ncbi:MULTISPECIES: hypothetical protein [Rubrivivax]|uniref:Uncharacterized protein n=1 Tax=Rubrivivax benzoatilyticus TaxID=316997 RepID=A0ABX0HY83_9BURK|nr:MULTISPECIES: hypothetical protein [Rubrivivax]EGJ08760.1 hypothetical protein RBXJA2T_00435 [Rubrivivax benzoatilyticus JA2 = ATCC BAA-35]MCD0418363.1 hypothetical protein [Rubrivivax sp. JA1024]NHK99965.1 hypothetical protein [Rubrivivax benzoatilyticus]NHL25756.1 hypothetical protein [Rubrivivax benzoatilyticus]